MYKKICWDCKYQIFEYYKEYIYDIKYYPFIKIDGTIKKWPYLEKVKITLMDKFIKFTSDYFYKISISLSVTNFYDQFSMLQNINSNIIEINTCYENIVIKISGTWLCNQLDIRYTNISVTDISKTNIKELQLDILDTDLCISNNIEKLTISKLNKTLIIKNESKLKYLNILIHYNNITIPKGFKLNYIYLPDSHEIEFLHNICINELVFDEFNYYKLSNIDVRSLDIYRVVNQPNNSISLYNIKNIKKLTITHGTIITTDIDLGKLELFEYKDLKIKDKKIYYNNLEIQL